LQQTIDAIGRRIVDVEAGLLVGDAVGISAAAELGLLAVESRERAPVSGIKGEQAVVVLDDVRGVGDDLADRLLQRRLREVVADDALL